MNTQQDTRTHAHSRFIEAPIIALGRCHCVPHCYRICNQIKLYIYKKSLAVCLSVWCIVLYVCDDDGVSSMHIYLFEDEEIEGKTTTTTTKIR